MAYRVEEVSGPFLLGEGPHWDDDRQQLYFVDSPASLIGRYDPVTKKTFVCKLDENKGNVSIVIPVKGKSDRFISTIGNQLVEVTWDGVSSKPDNIRVITKSLDGKRFNDGKVDPTGRLWVGTFGEFRADGTFEMKAGNLYSFDKDFKATQHVTEISIANGLAWSKDLSTMYYIDTGTKSVDAFDYDSKTGKIDNRRVVFDLSSFDLPEVGGADGMTIDTDDNLYVAVFGGSAVFVIDPKAKKLLRKIEIPSLHVTSAAFGGTNRDELYVVTSNFMLAPELKDRYPLAGYTFRVTGVGAKGHPMLSVQVD